VNKEISMNAARKVGTICVAVCGFAALAAYTPAMAADQVLVQRGSPVQIAVVLDHSGGLSVEGAGARNAVQMAVDKHSLIRGFPVQLNDFDGPCQDPAANSAVAAEVVANVANVAVIGHMCSPDERAALPIYEQADVVTVSGTATNPSNPTFAPHVFNSLLVPDDTPGGSDSWYARVQHLPRDVSWQADYAQRFGSPPTMWADLYYDVTSLLLDEIAAASNLDQGDLVINRSALALAVRTLSDSPALGLKGVTCWVNLDPRGYRVNDPASLDRCARQT
jgi:hypothetical protein